MNIVSLKLAESVGHFLRDNREKRGVKQKDIADVAAISVSMLSQIERGITSPSLETLGHICAALDVPLSELFASIEEKSEVTVSKRENRFVHRENGVTYEEVIHHISTNIKREFYILTLDPSSYITIGAQHKIAEEVQMGVVLTGSAVLTVDGDEYEINAGDVVSFRPKREHRVRNKSRTSFTLPKKCILLWTAKPPRIEKMVFGKMDT